jgi:uncharacterized metal-binding protein YceD (DUF177 family)
MAALPPNPDLEFSFPIDVTQLPAAGRDYTLTAKDGERRNIARRLNLLDLPSFAATLHVAPAAGGLIQLTGRISAEVTQSCVVSLEPVKSAIAEDFTLTYSRMHPKAAAEVDLDTEDDPPEVLDGDVLDLGEAAVEQLALFIDPYPRAPGAVFSPPRGAEAGPEKAVASPFAVLANLKTRKKNK